MGPEVGHKRFRGKPSPCRLGRREELLAGNGHVHVRQSLQQYTLGHARRVGEKAQAKAGLAQGRDGVWSSRQRMLTLVDDTGEIEQNGTYHAVRMFLGAYTARASIKQSRAHSRFLRIVVREAHDACRQTLLMPIKLADFDFSSELARSDIDAGERDRLLQDRRAGGAGDHADLRAADMNAIAMTDRFIAFHLQSNELALRIVFAPHE